ncbi:MAG TPA: hypothetical protein VF626_06015, partial [Chthoniobacterales bacterium]
GFHRKELTGPGIAKGSLLFSVSLIAAAAAVWSAWWLVRRIHPGDSQIAQGDSYSHGLYVLGFVALTLAISAAILGSFGRRISGPNLFGGALAGWAALMVAATIWVIGGSYLLTWPLFFALLGLGFGLLTKQTSTGPAVKLLIAFLCAIPGVVLVAPLLHLTFVAMPFALAPALILLLVLLLGLLIPLLRSSTAVKRWTFPGIAAAIALLFFVIAGRGAGFDKDRRQSNHVLYTLDATKQRALWVSFDARPDSWTAQFFGEKPERAPLAEPFPVGRRSYLQAPAPAVSLMPPEAKVLEDVNTNGVRHLRLRLTSPRGAERISVQISGEVLSAAVDRKPLISNATASAPQRNWSLYYFALPKEGIELALETRSIPPLALRVVDESYGLPLFDGAKFTDRPAHMMPAPFFRSDFCLVSQDFSF